MRRLNWQHWRLLLLLLLLLWQLGLKILDGVLVVGVVGRAAQVVLVAAGCAARLVALTVPHQPVAALLHLVGRHVLRTPLLQPAAELVVQAH